MARIEEADFATIGFQLPNGVDADTIIEIANTYVNDVLQGKPTDSPMSETRLGHIELYLAAHFASAGKPLAQSGSMHGFSASFAGNFPDGLNATRWGQMAMTLDTSGELAKRADSESQADAGREFGFSTFSSADESLLT